MVRVQELLEYVESIAPPYFAFGNDKVGLQVGDPEARVQKVVVSLDSSEGAVDFAVTHGAQALVSHHPLIWDPLGALTASTRSGRLALRLAGHGAAFIAAHTNWDCAEPGINGTLARLLGLQDVVPFGFSRPDKQYKLVVTVPLAAAERVIDAASGAGAGLVGQYTRCAFSSQGTGSFIPGLRANPTVGKPGSIESVEETRVEMSIPARLSDAAIRAVRAIHPYETPSIDLYALADDPGQPAGRIGVLATPLAHMEIPGWIHQVLDARCDVWHGGTKPIQRIAVMGGAAASEWRAALAAGADAYVTGEVPQHEALAASEAGLTIIAAGHFHTENPGMKVMGEMIGKALPVEALFFEPSPGCSGRPF